MTRFQFIWITVNIKYLIENTIYYLIAQLEEEEEIRRLKKELVPKAQPMPYFDRPFVPKK